MVLLLSFLAGALAVVLLALAVVSPLAFLAGALAVVLPLALLALADFPLLFFLWSVLVG